MDRRLADYLARRFPGENSLVGRADLTDERNAQIAGGLELIASNVVEAARIDG